MGNTSYCWRSIYGVDQNNFNACVYNSKGISFYRHLYKDGLVNLTYINKNIAFKTKMYIGTQEMYYEILDKGIYANENQLAHRLHELTNASRSSCGTYINNYIWGTHVE